MHSEPPKTKIKRHTVSDLDGTQQGGLVFCIVVLAGMIGATVAHPAALTSFWVWFILLMMAVSIALGIARLFGRPHDGDETD